MTSNTTNTTRQNEHTSDILQELLCLNIDSAKGYEECAELTKDHGLIATFSEIAHQRRENAQVLKSHSSSSSNDSDQGSYSAALHRAWICIKDACSGDERATLLNEVVRGEGILAEAYSRAVEEIDDRRLCDDLAAQSTMVTAVQGRMRALLEAIDSSSHVPRQ